MIWNRYKLSLFCPQKRKKKNETLELQCAWALMCQIKDISMTKEYSSKVTMLLVSWWLILLILMDFW